MASVPCTPASAPSTGETRASPLKARPEPAPTFDARPRSGDRGPSRRSTAESAPCPSPACSPLWAALAAVSAHLAPELATGMMLLGSTATPLLVGFDVDASVPVDVGGLPRNPSPHAPWPVKADPNARLRAGARRGRVARRSLP